jgi:hypothetical protein
MKVCIDMKVYKIRDKATGLFSSGGSMPDWSSKGKAWNNRGALSSHLSIVNNIGVYNNAEMIEYETIENAIIPIVDLLEQKKLKKAEQTRKYNEYIQKTIEERERKLLEELKQKYE